LPFASDRSFGTPPLFFFITKTLENVLVANKKDILSSAALLLALALFLLSTKDDDNVSQTYPVLQLDALLGLREPLQLCAFVNAPFTFVAIAIAVRTGLVASTRSRR
jgi:hypothetical protein